MGARQRQAGILLPLFSLRSARDWGIGEIPDLVPTCHWLSDFEQKVLQLLPANDIGHHETSPYAALSAFALDPLYIALESLSDFTELDRSLVLDADDEAALAAARAASRVDYGTVRRLKFKALDAAYERFRDHELAADSERARRFTAFRSEHRHWLDPYALFTALRDGHEHRGWEDWPAEARDGMTGATIALAGQNSASMERCAYWQWIAAEQWQSALGELRAAGVKLMGDLPYIVGRDSADVWAHRHLFALDVNCGAPPDQYSDTGQNWGLPGYRWDAMKRDDFAWMRQRAARAAELYDLFRVDHVVGLFRTWTIPHDGSPPHFRPGEEHEQRELGGRVLAAMQGGAGEARIVAEDLGVIPDWVRQTLAEMDTPGYKVLRWEKDGNAFRDPAHYFEISIATTGNHDTEPLPEWWEGLPDWERGELLNLPGLASIRETAGPEFTPAVHAAILEMIYASPSELVLLPLQDLLGLRERINTPGTVGEQNWTWRMPWNVEELRGVESACGPARVARELIERTGRSPGAEVPNHSPGTEVPG